MTICNVKVAYYGGWEFPEAFTRGIFKGFTKGVNAFTPGDLESREAEGNEVYVSEVHQ